MVETKILHVGDTCPLDGIVCSSPSCDIFCCVGCGEVVSVVNCSRSVLAVKHKFD